MLLEKLKKILPNNGNEYPMEFRQIIKNIYLESDPDKETVNFIWEAFRFSNNAHEGQKRQSGEPYLPTVLP